MYDHTKITLYDIPTTLPGRRAVSPFTARIRYVLNYRGLSYTTCWIEFKDVEQTCIKLGVAPTGTRQDGSIRYTLPIIVDETTSEKQVVCDSFAIAQYLDAKYPDPDRPLFPSPFPSLQAAPALHLAFDAYMLKMVFPALHPFMAPEVFKLYEGEENLRLWLRTDTGGRPIEAIHPGERGSKQWNEAWDKLKAAFGLLDGFYASNGGGSQWFMGDKPTYADFVLLGLVMAIRWASPDNVWKEVRTWSGGRWEKLVEVGEKYTVLK